MMFDRRLLQNFDFPLALLTYTLAAIGLVTIYSAVAPGVRGAGEIFCVKQAVWFGIGTGAMICVFSIHYSLFDKWVWLVYGASVFLLAYVLVFGKTVSGAQRWVSLGPFTLQPSEPAKIAVIIALAHAFSRVADQKGMTLADLIKPAAIVAVPFLLILLEPDLGSALLLVLIGGVMALYAGIRRKALITLLVLALAAAPIGWSVLKDYQKERIMTFLSPEKDPLGAGYHVIQSKVAIGSGALSGKGYLDGTQKALSYLPEQHTDFIFSVFAEEWGFLGSTSLLILFLVWLALMLNVARRSKDPFGSLLAVGVAAAVFWQLFVNIGMVMGLMPVVGVPLPLVSYGGSSVLTTLVGVGLLLNVGMRRFMFE